MKNGYAYSQEDTAKNNLERYMTRKKTILVVDDEEDILNLLDFNLDKAGYATTLARNGVEAIEIAKRKALDLILLDVMLPGIDGVEVLKRLKKNKESAGIPVIMLTARGEEIDKVLGFELGVEDYITKPFSPRELILRVRAILKRFNKDKAPGLKVLNFKEVSIDLAGHRVSIDGKALDLTSTEYNLLTALIEADGAVLTRDTLLDRAWGVDCYVLPRTVDVHIKRLRSKMGSGEKYIETVRGVGYRIADSNI